MDVPELPNRIIAYGEELLGDRINVYNKFEKLRMIIDSLDPFEREYIQNSPLAMVFELHNKPAWSTSFALFLLARLLNVEKKHELWVIYAGTPVRFSLREFKIVTGLPCGKYPTVPKKKKKNTAGKEVPYYGTLFGLEEGVSVDRVIDILAKRSITDPQLRLRYACLALVDGFLLPASHHPKINKDHAEMSKDIDAFVSYPWGRMSFEMIMTSIKERKVEQLATTAVTVHGFLYALQLVLIEAVPSIQEVGLPTSNAPAGSDGESENVAPAKQSLAFKLGHAREIDSLCEAEVTSIIHPEVEFNPEEEDISWSEDEEDELVDNMVELIGKGFEFDNSMFKGGVIPSECGIGTLQPKRGVKSRDLRTRKPKMVADKPVTPPRKRTNKGVKIRSEPVRRSPRQHSISTERSKEFDINVLSSMIDEKLAVFEKRIFRGITKWISDHVVFAGDQPNDSTHTNVSDRGQNPRDGSGVHKKQNVDRGKKHVVMEDSVEDIAAFYNDQFGEAHEDVGPSHRAPNSEHVVVGNDEQGSVEVSIHAGHKDDESIHFGNEAQARAENLPEHVSKTVVDANADGLSKGTADSASPNVGQKDHDSVKSGYENQACRDHVSVNTIETEKVSKEHNSTSSTSFRNKEGRADANLTTTEEIGEHSPTLAEPDKQNSGPIGLSKMEASKAKETVNVEVNSSVEKTINEGPDTVMEDIRIPMDSSPPEDVDLDANLDASAAIPAEPLAIVTSGKVVDIPVTYQRRSKRARTLSSKFDSRFQCDKKTKLLVGHPSPTNSEIEVENRFTESIEKLRTRSQISVGDGVFLTNKDILALLERKKQLSSKVVDALMRFSRFLLRTADVDGKKLKVDVLDSQFISTLMRLHPKFAKAADPGTFVFPTELVSSIAGKSESSECVQLFAEVDFIYAPFNFDRKNWVALCIDVRAATILVLDTNVQHHSDSRIASELKPIADMFPYLLKSIILPHQSVGKPFLIERKLGIAQVTNPADSGLMTIFLIHAHATGGFEECRMFFLCDIEKETKKLICGLLSSGIA